MNFGKCIVSGEMNKHPFNRKTSADFFPARIRNFRRPPFFSSTPAEKETVDSEPERLEEEPEKAFPLHENARTEFMARLEAALFLAREPMSVRRLVQLAEISEGSKPRTLLRELNERYDRQQCAFRVVEVAGGFQLRTRPEFAPWLVRMQEVPTTVRLSTPAMETLAVIAYKQPVLRAEIERLRGVQCGELIRQLLDRDLVRIVGRSEELGRPFFYGTTKNFLEVFGLGSLGDLPARQRLAAPNPEGKVLEKEDSEDVTNLKSGEITPDFS